MPQTTTTTTTTTSRNSRAYSMDSEDPPPPTETTTTTTVAGTSEEEVIQWQIPRHNEGVIEQGTCCGTPGCKAKNPKFACSRCNKVFYCNAVCQRAAYKAHKQECHETRKRSENALLTMDKEEEVLCTIPDLDKKEPTEIQKMMLEAHHAAVHQKVPVEEQMQQAWTLEAYQQEMEWRNVLLLLEKEFKNVWGVVLDAVADEAFDDAPKTWSAIGQSYDIHGGMDSDDEEEDDDDKEEKDDDAMEEVRKQRDQVLAGEAALKVDDDTSTHHEDDEANVQEQHSKMEADDAAAIDNRETEETNNFADADKFEKIKLTREVLKWLKEADSHFRGIFIKKVRRLAQGDRSVTMMKNLKGSITRIYETYLEQKSGQRIIWTGDTESGLLIWYVAAHKKVSRYMKRIDESTQRTARPLMQAVELPEIKQGLEEERLARAREAKYHDTGRVLLDPKGDTPLKLYELTTGELDRLQSSTWRPPLHLTPKEREIVVQTGTVCILGRSGTGKTVCIANRISHDRHLGKTDPSFSQLFIARSQRICNYVKDAVGEEEESVSGLKYHTYRRLLDECEAKLKLPNMGKHDGRHRIDFSHFKDKIYDANKYGLDPLVVWTQIRSFIKGSFIKGSILAVQDKIPPLTREEYKELGSNQCRLDEGQREKAYDAFEAYQYYLKDNAQLWDDMDRVASIIGALFQNKDVLDALKYTKLYVDEVQDYTQAELAMFFLLCSNSGGLFLAGDPAQNVEEGVDFRFEDVRVVANELSVLFKLSKGNKKYIPDKPMMLRVNFRSHAGVLNLAAGVLDRLFAAFPGSAKELPKDEGLFLGPKPGVFQNISRPDLKKLVDKQQGVVILTMNEDKVADLQKLVGDDVPVLSIRESKGLEFNLVMLVDFFNGMSKEHQDSWKALLVGRDDDKSDIKETTPEVEAHLKQLYTAITRCCKRLLLAETEVERGGSIALDAFEKWAIIRRAKEERLVDKMNVATVEEVLMTRDEWVKMGTQFATRAEECTNTREAKKYLLRAIRSFEQGKSNDLAETAKTHLESIELRAKMQSFLDMLGDDENAEDDDDLWEEANLEESCVALLVQKLIMAGLLLEARKLVEMGLRFMNDEANYKKDNIRERIALLLPDLDY